MASSSASLKRRFTRNRIAEAAMDLFSAKGFEDATVADILEAAGIARRTFYRHFANKEEVLEELYRMMVRALQDEMAEATRDAEDLWTGTMRGLDVYLDFHVSNRALLLTMLTEAGRESSPLHAHRSRFRATLVDLLGGALAAKGGRRYDPYVSEALLGALDGLSLRLLRGSGGEDEIARMRAVIHGLLALVCRRDAPLPLAP